MLIPKTREREQEVEQERALRSVDPRQQNPRQRPRMRMLAEDPPSTVERGTLLDHFIDPDES